MAKLRLHILEPDGHVNVYEAEDGSLQTDWIQNLKSSMAGFEKRCSEGDGAAALQALHLAYMLDEPIPEWAIRALSDACLKGVSGKISSWDEAFGRPNTKAQWERFHRDMDNAMKIWNLVAEAKASGKPIDNELMHRIGTEGGYGARELHKAKTYEEAQEALEPYVRLLAEEQDD